MNIFNREVLSQPINNAPLVLFRAVFGLLITLEAGGAIATGWVKRVFVEPSFHFTFMGFEWLNFLQGEMMYGYFALMAVAGIFVMLGLFYRPAMVIYAIMWTSVYLAQKTAYNNHYYLLMLLCWIMAFMPANKRFSLDARRNPNIASDTMPQGIRWFWIAQITIVYTYAAIAKIYPDWLEGKFVELAFEARKDWPIIGPLLNLPYFALIVSYSAILFDGLISPLLLWKKTRKWAFISSLAFHLFNSAIFHIGIFPFMSIAFALFFYEPEQIAKLFQWLFRPDRFWKPVRSKQQNSFDERRGGPVCPPDTTGQTHRSAPTWVVSIALTYLLFQTIIPLRHWIIPGNVLWTEEGHRCSWRMMLRAKSGYVRFTVEDKSKGIRYAVRLQEYLTPKQIKAMATKPDMIWQFAQFLKEDYARKGIPDVAVYAKARVGINGRDHSTLTDDTIDLGKIDWKTFGHQGWILENSL